MYKRKRLKHKADPFVLLILFAFLGMFLTTLSASDVSTADALGLAVFKDGEVELAPIGQRGGGVFMSVGAPRSNSTASAEMKGSEQGSAKKGVPGVHLSVIIPW